ncbi:D-3-phosphoglycerate dehydrogenase isoform X1 [Hydra vulgaris]|uniref:D-3-phosphoglycerate dehydrogenase isoform X1 n=1 Tax=Hydra vulgaris TaxID=6087 RepID=UPI001F5EE855|nr:D-3-phosphoglycerate dehydrogenase-like [Hydra vulgaris]
MNIKKVLISDKVDVSCQNLLEANGIEVDYKPGINNEQLKAIIADYDALIVRSATKVTADVFQFTTKLKLVGRAGTGVDNIDISSASSHGVLVMNTPDGNTISAAELTCTLISSLARNIGQGYLSLLQEKWEGSKFMGCELMGKTLAIIGLGRIGREVALRMQSFGMKTIGFDPLVSEEESKAFGVHSLPLEEIWRQSDFITVHTPLIPQTKGFINKQVFKMCKPGVKIINVARGGIVDEADLLDALNDGICSGAALDVFVSEPPTGTSMALVKHPYVLCTPHLGASTVEAQLRVAREIAKQIIDARDGKTIVGLVNAPALSQLSNPKYTPWMRLAEKLGSLISNIKGSTNINFSVNGEFLAPASRLLLNAFCYGFSKIHSLSGNLINAVIILKDLGINIKLTELKNQTWSSINVLIPGVGEFIGNLSGELPTVLQIYDVALCSPVVLHDYVIMALSTHHSSQNLLNDVLNINGITSVSTGKNGTNSVLVAAVESKVNVELPLVCLKI